MFFIPSANKDIIIELNEVPVTKMKVYQELEVKRQNWICISILWVVSALSMITNFSKALIIKTFRKRKFPFVKILWELGRDPKHISSIFVDRFSKYNHQAKYGAAGWLSLDLFYNYYEKVKPKLSNNLEGFLTRFWIERMENRQAVTNRFKIAVELLTNEIKKRAGQKEIRIFSIASGSAQAVISAMQNCPLQNVKAVLLDFDQSALDQAKSEVKKSNLGDKFEFVLGRTSRLENICKDFQPDIIEMIGFLDYRPKKSAIKLCTRIRKILPSEGTFITCNIRNNREKPFLNYVLLWPMIYRSKKELSEILTLSGFRHWLVYEPLGIHGIGICQKG